jgi:hypothetical protein
MELALHGSDSISMNPFRAFVPLLPLLGFLSSTIDF